MQIIETNTRLYSVVSNFVFTIRSLKHLYDLHSESPVNTVHALYPNSSLLAAVLFKLGHWKTKIIYDVRSPWIEMAIERSYVPKYAKWFFLWIAYAVEWFFSKFVDHFVFITKGLRDVYIKKIHITESLTTVIPTGVNVKNFSFQPSEDIRAKFGFTKNDKVLGFVGGLAFERQLDFVIKAFSLLINRDDRYRLLFVGDGPASQSLKELTKEMKLESQIIFTGKVKHHEVAGYISSLDIGICHLPDIFIYRQSFPLKILEYASCGIPVAASNIMAHKEIQYILRNIFLYDFSTTSFVDTIESINLKPPCTENRDTLESAYDWSALVRRYQVLYGAK